MFEAVSFETKVGTDGRLRVDVPLDFPPDSEVRVTVSQSPRRIFDREEWEAHVDRIAGSIPDLERPEQGKLREIKPL